MTKYATYRSMLRVIPLTSARLLWLRASRHCRRSFKAWKKYLVIITMKKKREKPCRRRQLAYMLSRNYICATPPHNTLSLTFSYMLRISKGDKTPVRIAVVRPYIYETLSFNKMFLSKKKMFEKKPSSLTLKFATFYTL